MRDHATIVFHLDFESRIRDDGASEFQDAGETVRLKPVIGVVTDMRLQHNLLFPPDLTAAIYEIPDDVTDFSQVRMAGNKVSSWKAETSKGFWMRFSHLK